MLPRIERVLVQWIAAGGRGIGEILIAQRGGAFSLRHREDETRADLQVFRSPNDATELARLDDAGNYRPLKTGPNLRHGWRLELLDLAALRLELDLFYSGRFAALAAWETEPAGTRPVDGRFGRALLPIAGRQTRMLADDSLVARRDRIKAVVAFAARQVHPAFGSNGTGRKHYAVALPGSMQPSRGRGAQGREGRELELSFRAK
jgi:hypothetical protein